MPSGRARGTTAETIVEHVVVNFDEPGRYSLVVGFSTGTAPQWENLPVSAAPASMLDASKDGVHLADAKAWQRRLPSVIEAQRLPLLE